MPSSQFNPLKDIPDLGGKVVVLTGGTSGVGAETVKMLAMHNPAQIYFTGRNTKAAESLIDSLKAAHPDVDVRFVHCDLSDLASIRHASNRIAAHASRIDILFCNAGVMALPPSLSKDGYEKQFATNHLGHAMLVDLLMPILEDTAAQPSSDVRIIITTSQAAAPPLPPPGGINFKGLRTEQRMLFGTWRRYAQSKLANLLYARALNKQYPYMTTVSIHPGIGYTGLQGTLSLLDRFIMWSTTIGRRSSVEQLAYTGLWAATAPKGTNQGQVEGGIYYEPVGVKPKLVGEQGNAALEDQLWHWTQREMETWKMNAGMKV